jgi:hypothetical protein
MEKKVPIIEIKKILNAKSQSIMSVSHATVSFIAVVFNSFLGACQSYNGINIYMGNHSVRRLKKHNYTLKARVQLSFLRKKILGAPFD